MASNFTLDLSKITQKAKGRIDLVTQKVTFDLFSSVILKSPVKSGRFRGNWIASVNSYGTLTVDIEDKTGSDATREMGGVALTTPAGNIVFMVNNLPYAQRLEYGYSSQAPAGMVRVTIAEFQDYVAKAVRGIR